MLLYTYQPEGEHGVGGRILDTDSGIVYDLKGATLSVYSLHDMAESSNCLIYEGDAAKDLFAYMKYKASDLSE